MNVGPNPAATANATVAADPEGPAMRAWSVRVLICVLLAIAVRSHRPAPSGSSWSSLPISIVGCNDDSINQIPSNPDFFVGRIPISTDAQGNRLPPPGNFGCSFKEWAIGLLRVDWTAMKLEFVRMLLWPNAYDSRFPTTPVQGGKYVLSSTYDPTAAVIGGEIWVSFECAGWGFFTSSCMGPLTAGPIENATIDLSRTTLVVTGTLQAAASVPKVFSFKGAAYMYFDHFLTGPGYIQQMGVPLEQDGAGRMWVQGFTDSMPITDPAALRVWWPSPRGDALWDAIADVYAIREQNGYLFITAGVGGQGCRAPSTSPRGCYRVVVTRTNFALGEDVLGGFLWEEAQLPGNAMEYAHFLDISGNASLPTGSVLLYANWFTPRGDPGTPIPQGFQGLLLSMNDSFWTASPSPCSDAQPWPNWGNRDGKCAPSCGTLGAGVAGLRSFTSTCERNGMKSLGEAYDVPYCCGPIQCGDSAHQPPNWGEKGGLCLPSCGGIGGTSSFLDPCSNHDLIDVGAAYDVAFCCGDPFPAGSVK
jgi:hypothetical protein